MRIQTFTTRLLCALALLVGLAAHAAAAAETQVAVAANFAEPAQKIAQAFEAKTGDKAVLSVGSSGQFLAQITHGAPFEVFLSADAERPASAEAQGYGVPGTRFTYATGRLVLWSAQPGLVDPKGAVLAKGDFAHIAIADPGAAPYGQAAVQAMQRLGVSQRLEPRIVKGASIAQAYEFVRTGAAELGFVALSQVIDDKSGSRWLVPQTAYDPIAQQAILLRPGEKNPAARAFLAFLKSPEARAIIRRYGYGD
jgi:molybdate transport system substrate-binding protein